MKLINSPVVDYDIYKKLMSEDGSQEFFEDLAFNDTTLSTRSRGILGQLPALDKLGINYKEGPISILEIGSGLGRGALEIMKLNPEATYTCITLPCKYRTNQTEPYLKEVVDDEKIFNWVNSQYNILNDTEMHNAKIIKPIKYRIHDSIKFIKSNSIDLVLSNHTYVAIERTDLLLQDIMRCLKINGHAKLPTINKKIHINGEIFKGEYFSKLLLDRGYEFAKQNGQLPFHKDTIYLNHHKSYIKKTFENFKHVVSPAFDENNKLTHYISC